MYKTHRIDGHPELDTTTQEDTITWATNEIIRLSEENDKLKEQLAKYEKRPAVRPRTAA